MGNLRTAHAALCDAVWGREIAYAARIESFVLAKKLTVLYNVGSMSTADLPTGGVENISASPEAADATPATDAKVNRERSSFQFGIRRLFLFTAAVGVLCAIKGKIDDLISYSQSTDELPMRVMGFRLPIDGTQYTLIVTYDPSEERNRYASPAFMVSMETQGSRTIQVGRVEFGNEYANTQGVDKAQFSTVVSATDEELAMIEKFVASLPDSDLPFDRAAKIMKKEPAERGSDDYKSKIAKSVLSELLPQVRKEREEVGREGGMASK